MLPTWMVTWKFYAVVGLVILYAGWQWGNVQWTKGFMKGEIKLSEAVEKARQEEWEKAQKIIDANIAELQKERSARENLTRQLAEDRRTLNRSLRDGLNSIRSGRNNDYSTVAAVPASQLDDAIRSVSRELASSQ